MLDLSKPNPLGLKAIAEVPANMTKRELAEAVLPADLAFDYALPQDWLDQFSGDEYWRMMCHCVTTYPPGSVFGIIVNLLTGEVYH